MKRNKLLYGFLAAALLMNSIAWPAPAVHAAAPDLDQGLTAYYTFDDSTLDNSVEGGQAAVPRAVAMGNYNGALTYDENGKEGGAVRLGSYGLDLNQKNLGDEFTVSAWMKPDGTFSENQNLMLLGYNNPEKWFGVAGKQKGSSDYKVWAHDDTSAQVYRWKTLEENKMDSEWHLLTLTGSSEKISAYMDGRQIVSEATHHPMVGDDQGVYIGVTFWQADACFKGLVDEVRVYNRTLSEAEIQMLYDGRSVEDLLEDTTVTESLKLPQKRSREIQVTLPAAVQEAGAAVSFESSAPDVASVDQDGKVTALKAGTAEITVRITLNGKTAEKKTQVTVQETLEESLVAYYNFDGNTENQTGAGGSAAALVTDPSNTKMDPYTGTIVYEDGREGQAVSMGDYGLRLNQDTLGEEYTVSLWLKPKKALTLNQCILLLGNQNPEQWLALSGASAGEGKIWAKGGIYGTHTTLFSPEIKAGQWYQLTLCGTKGKVTAYLDGICLGTKDSNDPLSAEGGDLYLGVNRWDDEFTGLMDEVKVYDIALDAEEVQNQDLEEFNHMLQIRVNKEISLRPAKILADNRNAQEVKYHLALPTEMDGLPIVWTSSDESVLKSDGSVITPAEDTKVTLTATVTNGLVSASREYQLTILAMDRSALDSLLEQAASVDRTNLLEASANRLDAAVAEAQAADSFAAIDRAADLLTQALNRLCYQKDYEAPFEYVISPAVRASVKVGAGEELFVLAENIQDAVDVEYVSENPAVASYADGTVTGVASGKTVVTAVVTSRYDQWKMEYSTAVSVEEDTPDNPGGDNQEPSNPGEDNQEPSDPGTDNQDPSEQPGADNQNPSVTPGTDSQEPSGTPDGNGSSGGSSRRHKSSRNSAAEEAAAAETVQTEATAVQTPVYGRGSLPAGASVSEQEAAGESAGTAADAGFKKNEAPSDPEEPAEFKDVEDEEVPQAGLEKQQRIVYPYLLLLAAAAGFFIFLIWKRRKQEEETEEI